jgi:hypothetical protein
MMMIGDDSWMSYMMERMLHGVCVCERERERERKRDRSNIIHDKDEKREN